MAVYLAQVQRKPINRVELHLLAVHYKRDDLWAKLAATEVVPIVSELIKLPDDALALATLSETKRLVNIVDAVTVLPSILHNLSLRVMKSITKEQEIKEWRESLEYQSSELSDRAAELAIRKKKLDKREQTILLRETYITKENVRLKEEQEALKNAWVALNLERIAMEKQ